MSSKIYIVLFYLFNQVVFFKIIALREVYIIKLINIFHIRCSLPDSEYYAKRLGLLDVKEIYIFRMHPYPPLIS